MLPLVTAIIWSTLIATTPTLEVPPMGSAAPGLLAEIPRLNHVGADLLGIVGDAAHTYGYHVPSGRAPASDYSMQGPANTPVGDYACAIDIGMNWPASRQWLAWLIDAIRQNRLTGIAEVIGSYDGHDVRYWSDNTGWSQNGVDYDGTGHDTWTHVAIYRSTANEDHKLLADWGPAGPEGEEDMSWDERFSGTNYQGTPYNFTAREIVVGTNEAAWKNLEATNAAVVALNAIATKIDALIAKIDAQQTGNIDTNALAAKLAPVISKAVNDELARRQAS